MNGIDRNELRGILYDVGVTGRLLDEAEAKVAALVQPADGISLTPEERDRVTGWFVKLGEPATDVLPEDRALFRKLEASA